VAVAAEVGAVTATITVLVADQVVVVLVTPETLAVVPRLPVKGTMAGPPAIRADALAAAAQVARALALTLVPGERVEPERPLLLQALL
jgi:hypothetical protein